ncbi:SDR family oxidoreductase [Christiangramia forsetii]|uniref:Short-chain dehydrogenase/reductase family protein n=2 Tax=Christiangramia forsetii TaxID=411153 RepID=A0M4X9_CHRFK|nr:SDR family oxidoreductase [Christiangramia forsetii]GGG22375.1 tropinone reductase [Christiangramia forsetii]CAL67674.1 short-chain dehydrogenase/reductase family protein [Christiangramia forsetii KT0803]
MWKLNDKKALITGGSKGIGKATVIEFLKLGAEVLFTARNEKDIKLLETELKEEGHQVTGLVADSAKPEDIKKIKNWIAERWNSLDILVNNAGINIRKQAIDYSEEEFRKVLEINLVAPFEISRALYPFLKKSGKASIINIASSAAIQDVGTGTPYAMSKSGLLQQSRSLAVEWAEDQIRVNSVSPWFTKTPLTEGYLHNEKKMDSILSRTPLKRVAEAEEISSIISFLAMDKSSFVTGQNIVADGGMSITAL